MPLINEPYPGGPPPLWKVLRNFALLVALGLLVAWAVVSLGSGERERAPRHPVTPSAGVTR